MLSSTGSVKRKPMSQMIKLRMFYRIMAVLLLTDPGQVAFAQDRPQVNCVA
jgi:hypothetical protein